MTTAWLAAQEHRGVCLWSHKHAAKAICGWHAFQQLMVWHHGQVYRGACLWSRAQATRGLVKWHEQAAIQQEQVEALYRAMFKWAHSRLSAAFSTWFMKAQAERMDEMLLIAMQHYRYASIFVVLDHWREMALQGTHRDMAHRENGFKADSHRRYSALQVAFEEWKILWLDKQSPAEVLVDQSSPENVLAQACHPYGMFSVSINGTTFGKQDRALYYVILVKFEGRAPYELNKRYRDFDVLNNTMNDRFGAILHSGPNSPQFPPKKPFTKLNPEFYESRATDLHQFTQDLIRHREVAASGELCEFLEFQNYYYQ